MSALTLSSRLKAAIGFILLTLLFFLPYSVLIIQGCIHLFEAQGHPLPTTLIRLLHGWKELLLAIGLVCALAEALIDRALPFAITRLDWLFTGFIALAVVISFLTTDGSHSLVQGFRYGLTPFLYYFLARCLTLRRPEILTILRNLVLAGLPILLFSLLQSLVLPADLLVHLGYAAGSDMGMPATYGLPSSSLARAFATFAHPADLGLYIGQILLLVLFCGRQWFAKWLTWGVAALAALTLILTFSNQPVVGLVVSILIVGAMMGLDRYLPRTKAYSSIVLAGLVLIVLSGLTVTAVRLDRSVPSTPSPIQRAFESDMRGSEGRRSFGFDQISEYPYGRGLGSTGQALTNQSSLNYEQPVEPYSWYVQIGQELGWLGLALAALMVVAIIQAFHQLSQVLHDKADRYLLGYLVSGFLAIAVTLVFISAWLEAGTITWWILFGLFLSDYFGTFPGESRFFPIQKSAASGNTRAAR